VKATGCDVVLCCVVSTCNQIHSARQEKDRGGTCLRIFAVTLDIINTIHGVTDQSLRGPDVGEPTKKVNKLAEVGVKIVFIRSKTIAVKELCASTIWVIIMGPFENM
jgi:hypothetical protein